MRTDPPSSINRALALVLDGLRVIVRAELAAHEADPSELLDQCTSGLGRELHCKAWRAGQLRGRKFGRRILVTRADRDHFIEEYGAPAPLRKSAPAKRDAIERDLEELFGAAANDAAPVRHTGRGR